MGMKDFSIKAAAIRADMKENSDKMLEKSIDKLSYNELQQMLAGEAKPIKSMGLEVE